MGKSPKVLKCQSWQDPSSGWRYIFQILLTAPVEICLGCDSRKDSWGSLSLPFLPAPAPIPMDFHGSIESRAPVRVPVRIPSSSARLTGTYRLRDCVCGWKKLLNAHWGTASPPYFLLRAGRRRVSQPTLLLPTRPEHFSTGTPCGLHQK